MSRPNYAETDIVRKGLSPTRLFLNGSTVKLVPPNVAAVVMLDTRAKPWEAGKEYSIAADHMPAATVVETEDGDPTAHSFKAFQPSRFTTGAEEPDWPTEEVSNDDRFDDGQNVWSASIYDAEGWRAFTDSGEFTNGQIVVVGDVLFTITTPGTTGATVPDWSTAPDFFDGITDGNIVWTNVGSLPEWTPSTTLPVLWIDPQLINPQIRPTTGAGVIWTASYRSDTIYGVTGDEEPDWNVGDLPQFTFDGDIIWALTTETGDQTLRIFGMDAPKGDSAKVTLIYERGFTQIVLYDESQCAGVNARAVPASGDGIESLTNNAPDTWDLSVRSGVECYYLDTQWQLFGFQGSGPD